VALLETLLILLVASALAGLAGSFLGIGGGVFLIPFMSLAMGLDLRVAIAISLVGVIATSSGAASVYVRDHLTNLRLGMSLEIATTTGALLGAACGVVIALLARRRCRSGSRSDCSAWPSSPRRGAPQLPAAVS